MTTFRRCVARHKGDHKVESFTCLEQLRIHLSAYPPARTWPRRNRTGKSP
ncbi:MAG: DUF4372 domain-containing protein [Pseudomonadota bacterium]|nr:DUF4372 domain-containing protein [Pseudomonadota bacterium]